MQSDRPALDPVGCLEWAVGRRQSCTARHGGYSLDVAIDSLREAWRSRKVTMDELVEAAEVDRVSKIMRPYLEATV